MKSKTICFCIRGRNSKSKENEVKDLEKLSHVKPGHKGKTKESDSTTPLGDDGGINVHGASTVASNDAGVTAAFVAATHVSLMSANEGQDGCGHGGESGADGDERYKIRLVSH
ncbi:hypothetical protein CR513_14382, partial [Mucuna pruriens]